LELRIVDWLTDKLHAIADYVVHLGTDIAMFTWSLILAIAIIIGINWIGSRLRNQFHKRYPKPVENNPAASALFDNLFRIFVVIIGVVIGLGVAGVPSSSLVTWIGVIVAALSLALQGIIQNLVSGLYLLVEQPFTVGDRITVQNQTGTVQRVALRVTVMRNARQEMVMIPNFIVFTESVRAKIGIAPECLVLQVAPISAPLETINDELMSIIVGVIGNADPKPTLTLDAMRPAGASVTVRIWLTDAGRQQNLLIAALHQQFPDASIEVTEDAWVRQILQPRI
jgi:small-conductance mechanosensitive channel